MCRIRAAWYGEPWQQAVNASRQQGLVHHPMGIIL